MKRILCCGIICLLFINALPADYSVFENNGKYGLKDDQGNVVINAAFDGLGWSDGSFSIIGGVTGYQISNRWGLINLKEQPITSAEYLSIEPTGGDRFVVKKRMDAVTSKMGCINLKGDVVIPLKYDGIRVSELRAVVFVKVGYDLKFGVINLDGETIIPLQYKKIYSIGNFRYAVQNFENKSALFSDAGNRLTDFVIDSISSFKKDKAIIFQGLQQGVINRQGIIVTSPVYREVQIDENGNVKARNSNTWIVITKENQTIQAALCDELTPIQDGFKIKSGNKEGLWNREFKTILSPQYDEIVHVESERLVVRTRNKYGLIELNNAKILPLEYDSIILTDRFVRVRERLLGQGSWMLYDIYGIRKSERSYEFIYPFNGRFFLVKNYGLLGVMDKYGKEIVHCVYDSILDYNENQLLVKFHGHYGIIDLKENWLLPPQEFPIQLIDDEHYLLNQHGTHFFKSFAGALIYFTDNPIGVDGQRLKEVLPDGTEKEISFTGVTLRRTKPAILEGTEIVGDEYEGLRAIKRNGKYGFIDSEGKLRIANRYEAVGNFSHGLAPIRILGKWGFVDAHDKIIINPSYEWVSEFKENVAIVKRGKFGLVNGSGEIVLEPRYDKIQRVETGHFLLVNNGLLGLASKEGHVLIDPRFTTLQPTGDGHVIISVDKKFGLVTESGFSVIPMVYDKMNYLGESSQYLVKQESPWIALNIP